jgi:penicillin-binding protein 1A
MVSIRILDAIGPKYAQDYVTRFGFEPEKHPPYLTMALGAGSVTVWQMARAYSVFANGGFLVQPYFIMKIVDDRGNPLALASPQRAGDESLRVLDPRNAFIMDSMMQDTTRSGTAARAARLGRSDLAGKTGTTNEFVDAWFAGYQPNLVGVSWVGFDQPKTLGRNQTGSVVALPIWLGYMERALKEIPDAPRSAPDGVVALPMQVLTPGTDTSLPHAEPKVVPEFFYQESVPPPEVLRPIEPLFTPPPAQPAPPPVQPPA